MKDIRIYFPLLAVTDRIESFEEKNFVKVCLYSNPRLLYLQCDHHE
jgi:hypothetical protein